MNSQIVLIVDDEPNLRELIAEEFLELGCTVFEAADGLEALAILRTVKVDILLTDIQMPNLDGRQLLKRMMSELHYQPDIFLFTASQISQDEADISGVKRVFKKPISINEMLTAIVQSATSRLFQVAGVMPNRGLKISAS